MNFVKLLPVIFSFLVLSAHYSRSNNIHMSLAFLFLPLILLIKRKWVIYISYVFLLFANIVWMETTYKLILARQHLGEPYLRLTIILGIVSAIAIMSMLVFKNAKLQKRFTTHIETATISTFSFILTWILLNIASSKVSFPIILIDRFLPGFGGVEIIILSIYAAFISEKLYLNGFTKLRGKIWNLFSLLFFIQFTLGLLGFTEFLMTGKLHLPIPALIVGSPIFRGEGFFMIILFTITIILAGPAWCSYFCYIGAWDSALSKKDKTPSNLKINPRYFQLIILFLVIFTAYSLKILGASSFIATLCALFFMTIGIGIMILFTRKKGVMVHCTAYCPIGILSTTVGKINPFRVKINNDNCTDCMKCTTACRYHCLSPENVKKRTPSFGCTLCGDCLDNCPHNALDFRFYNSKKPSAKKPFVVVVSVIHAVFIGVARI